MERQSQENDNGVQYIECKEKVRKWSENSQRATPGGGTAILKRIDATYPWSRGTDDGLFFAARTTATPDSSQHAA